MSTSTRDLTKSAGMFVDEEFQEQLSGLLDPGMGGLQAAVKEVVRALAKKFVDGFVNDGMPDRDTFPDELLKDAIREFIDDIPFCKSNWPALWWGANHIVDTDEDYEIKRVDAMESLVLDIFCQLREPAQPVESAHERLHG